MAVRLQMRLGVVAESERLPDSPDRIIVVEPSIGSVARTKGSLYLLVTCSQPGGRPREATRIVAETIRDQYYYDESAGIRVCLVKAIVAASKRLAHDRDRYGLRLDGAGNGPIGVAVAVVRGSELYVATVGPAEAYLIRQARLSTLPDPYGERGLPSPELEPEVWRGDLAVGDALALVSPNLMARVGVDALRDALVSLHPQSAMEHLHHGFVAADGRGSDGALAFEATEVSATQGTRGPVPVHAPEPLAGAPEKSPIPLADSVSGGVAAVQAQARQARSFAGGTFSRMLWRIQDLLPRRDARYRRVTPISSRQRTQRRMAFGVIALALVAAAAGIVVFLGGGGPQEGELSSLTAGQRALKAAQDDLTQVSSPGIDLVADDPQKAEQLLSDAYRQLAAAEQAGIATSTTDPLRQRTIAALDRLYHVVDVAPSVAFTFGGKIPPNLTGLVLGPDGVPYVLDQATKAVYRVDLKTKKAVPIVRMGTVAAGVKVGEPRFLVVGGPDLLILDSKNALWRWRPADRKGTGTLTRVKVNGATTWGADVRAIGTYLRNPDAGLYNLYVVDPSERQILRYSPAADGSGFPAPPSGYLATAQSVDSVTSLFIDGDVFTADAGAIDRYVAGHTGDWKAADPGDELLRPTPDVLLVASGTTARQGLLYGYDRPNARVLAYDKASGDFREQYRLAGDATGWSDVRAMYVVVGTEGDPSTLWWIDSGHIMSAPLVAAPVGGPSVSPSPSASSGPKPSPKASAAPKKTPRPSATP
jgi:hypothetical protein